MGLLAPSRIKTLNPKPVNFCLPARRRSGAAAGRYGSASTLSKDYRRSPKRKSQGQTSQGNIPARGQAVLLCVYVFQLPRTDNGMHSEDGCLGTKRCAEMIALPDLHELNRHTNGVSGMQHMASFVCH